MSLADILPGIYFNLSLVSSTLQHLQRLYYGDDSAPLSTWKA